MATYKITANTNSYIAQRDIHFNGRTQYVIADNLTKQEAEKKLEDLFCADYDTALFIDNENDWIFNIYFSQIESQASAANMSVEEYFKLTLRRWKLKNSIEAKSTSVFANYEGEGYYRFDNYGGAIFQKGDQSYEYDSRYYRIEIDTDTESIIDDLENKRYHIDVEHNCDCRLDWEIDYRGELTDENSDFDCCWVGKILYLDNSETPIAEYIAGEGFRTLLKGLNDDDIPESVKDEMNICDSNWPENQSHTQSRRNALIRFLNEQKEEGYKLMRDNERGFANQYTCILVAPDAIDQINDDWDELEAENWADEFLYKGDNATQAFNSFKLIK